jgi:hypothetical protein
MVLLRKGQVETMGLVIIVILLIFIGIFALSFSIKDKEINEDILTLKANSLRSSLLKTNICNITIKDEIGNCFYNRPRCLDSCDSLNNVIDSIIKNSLEGEKYYFKFKDIELGSCVDKVTSVSEVIEGEKVEIAVCRR